MSKLPDIKNNFPEWYHEIIYSSGLADESPVRGCMVVRPYGCAIWENITAIVDKRLKETGHHNAIFPLFIPESFLKKEAQHVEGFSPELAVVTHAGGKPLEEPLVVRPTSETIIHFMFAKWIKSWRDLPLKINQWANVVRWEMRSRPFLRTTEFYWQEGHTAHETLEEAEAEVQLILNQYVDLAQNYLAIPVVPGQKSKGEQFPGADKTFTFEAFMQDGKALQMGTSHLISQNFAKAFNMQFQNREGGLSYPFLTSWAVTTRLIGAMVMVHGDQKGLIVPPKVAPIQVVIIPIFKKGEDKSALLAAIDRIKIALKDVRVFVDADEQETPGSKFYNWELKGIPVRIEIGPRDLANNQAMVADRLGLGKNAVALDDIATVVTNTLDVVQKTMFDRAAERRAAMWFKEAKLVVFGPKLDEQPGFYQAGFCQKPTCEAATKEYKATIRCLIPQRTFEECYNCSDKSVTDVLVAKSY